MFQNQVRQLKSVTKNVNKGQAKAAVIFAQVKTQFHDVKKANRVKWEFSNFSEFVTATGWAPSTAYQLARWGANGGELAALAVYGIQHMQAFDTVRECTTLDAFLEKCEEFPNPSDIGELKSWAESVQGKVTDRESLERDIANLEKSIVNFTAKLAEKKALLAALQ